MNRQKIGYALTLIALIALVGFYGTALFSSYHGNIRKTFFGASLTIIPLLYLTAGAIYKKSRSYVALAILSPLHLFFGGVIFIWGAVGQGIWVCCWALILQVGTILHTYHKREKKAK